MRNWLTFNGKSTKEYGVYISGSDTFNAPERDTESVVIPGRDGELTIDNGRYKNISVEYPAFIYDQFNCNIEGFRNFLLSQKGYGRLEDTYHPQEFRMAKIKGSFKVDPVDSLIAGQFKISFDCKPQRFLKLGETPIEITAATSIKNPTLHSAKPLIRVYGYGQIFIGDYGFTVRQHTQDYMDIDCEMMDAFCGATNLNQYLTIGSNGFPKIDTGVQGITLAGTVTKIIITPRWFNI